MIVDSSAIIAMLTGEPDRGEFINLLTQDPIRRVSTVSIVEAGLVMESRTGANGAGDLDLWLLTAGVKVESFDANQADIARRAWRKYGRGRHPAALNFGDCCAYALAKAMNEPILCKGNDFSLTDVAVIQPRVP